MQTLAITGPFKPTGPGDTPSRRRIFTCRPATPAAESACARQILSALARRAYRKPVTDADLQPVLSFYDTGRARSGFERGIQMGLQRILASPQFMFRVERDPANVAPGAVYRISDVELASRLSFFLWSSIPDDELLKVASQGKLKEPAVLEQQVRRMLASSRSRTLVTNFAGQWLHLRNVRSVLPNSDEFPDFDDNVRQAFLRETELFVDSIMREDRNVLDLLRADYTFVNERLARHYGIPDVYGSYFRRVAVTDEARKGLLGQGSILAVTSHAERTSPVLRGKWVLDNIVGTPPPPPPPDIPALKENEEGQKPRTMREQMAEHRANAGVRELPQSDGSDRLRARELRRRRRVAHARGRWNDRCVGRAGGRHESGRRGDAAQRAAQPARGVRRHDDREAADLRAGPRARRPRYAGRPIDRPAVGGARLSVLVARARDRE